MSDLEDFELDVTIGAAVDAAEAVGNPVYQLPRLLRLGLECIGRGKRIRERVAADILEIAPAAQPSLDDPDAMAALVAYVGRQFRIAGVALSPLTVAPTQETKAFGSMPLLDVSASYDAENDCGAVFLVNVPLVLLLIGLTVWIVPNSSNPNGEKLDPLGALLSVAALGSLVFGIIEGPEWGWGSARVLGAFGVAVVAGVGFVVWGLRAREPMLDPRLFRLRGFAMGSLAITTAFFCMFGTYFLLAQYLQFVHGYTALGSAVRTLPAAVVMVIVSPRSPSAPINQAPAR